jgi:hypothetical protein
MTPSKRRKERKGGIKGREITPPKRRKEGRN